MSNGNTNLEFSPDNHIVQLCLRGMAMEGQGKLEEAADVFQQAWQEGRNDFEKFIVAYFVARQQKDVADQLKWLQTAVYCAEQINNVATRSALPLLYSNLAVCFAAMGNQTEANKCTESAAIYRGQPDDNGPFFHGTRADLKVGDLLTAGRTSNYDATLTMNHVYFTALMNGAGLAAALAKGEGPERVYIVEPAGPFENDPNVTDKKFPGNLTRSYRTAAPLKVIGEITDWAKQSPEDLIKWREKLASNQGEIIN
jgi:rifampin ADP-ribosylating transferase